MPLLASLISKLETRGRLLSAKEEGDLDTLLVSVCQGLAFPATAYIERRSGALDSIEDVLVKSLLLKRTPDPDIVLASLARNRKRACDARERERAFGAGLITKEEMEMATVKKADPTLIKPEGMQVFVDGKEVPITEQDVDISFVRASLDRSGGMVVINPARVLDEMARQFGLAPAQAFKRYCAATLGVATTTAPLPDTGTNRDFNSMLRRAENAEANARAAEARESVIKKAESEQRLRAQGAEDRAVKAEGKIAAVQEELANYVAIFAQLRTVPTPHASVVAIREETITVQSGGRAIEVGRPKDLEGRFLDLVVGGTVRVMADTMQVVGVVKDDAPTGEVLPVSRVVNERTLEVDRQGAQRAVVYAQESGKVEEGDRVVLDMSGTVVISNLGKPVEVNCTGEIEIVRWGDIGGLEKAKRELREAIEAPVRHGDKLARYGKRPSRGVLLYGGPGLGKTMLAKAAAHAFAELHAKTTCKHCGVVAGFEESGEPCAGFSAAIQVEAKAGDGSTDGVLVMTAMHEFVTVPVRGGFYSVKGPEMLDKFVGETEGKIRRLFQQARQHKKKTGYPAIIFIDEAEAILAPRGGGQTTTRGFLSQTIVPQFLSEMDGLEESGAFVILATNHPSNLDSAIVRDGRMDRKIKVTRPTKEDARAIASRHLSGKPLVQGVDEAAAELVTALYDPGYALYRVKRKSSVAKGTPVTMAAIVSGAMIAGIVDRASSEAMRRALENETGREEASMLGPDDLERELITPADIRYAVGQAFHESRDVNHEQELQEFTEGWENDVVSVTKERSSIAPGAS